MADPQIEALKAWLDRPDHAFLDIYISPENLPDAVVPEADTFAIPAALLRAALDCVPPIPLAVQRTVTKGLLNVRDAPSFQAGIMTHLEVGTKVMVETGTEQGVWRRLLGWISADYLK